MTGMTKNIAIGGAVLGLSALAYVLIKNHKHKKSLEFYTKVDQAYGGTGLPDPKAPFDKPISTWDISECRNGSVNKLSDTQASEFARQFHDAFGWFWNDYSSVASMVKKLESKYQAKQVMDAFQDKYGKPLIVYGLIFTPTVNDPALMAAINTITQKPRVTCIGGSSNFSGFQDTFDYNN